MFRFFTKLNNITEFLLQGKAFSNEAIVIIAFALPFYPHQWYRVFVVQPYMSTSNVELSNPVFSMCEYFFLLAFCLYFKTLSEVVLPFSKYDLTEPYQRITKPNWMPCWISDRLKNHTLFQSPRLIAYTWKYTWAFWDQWKNWRFSWCQVYILKLEEVEWQCLTLSTV